MRTLPNNQEAEASAIGCCLLRPEIADEVDLEADDFFVPRHTFIWQAIVAVRARGDAVDEITLGDELQRSGKLDAVGGYSALSRLVIDTPTAANVAYYAEIVKRAARARRLMIGLSEAIERGFVDQDPDEIWASAERVLRSADRGKADPILSAKDLIKRRMLEYDAIVEAQQRGDVALSGVPTGMDSLDKMLGGIQPGIVTICAGRPGMGKSAFALAVTKAALEHGHGVHVFSLEDSRAAYTDRMLGGESRVPVEKLRAMGLSREEYMRVGTAAGTLARREGLAYYDGASIGAEELVRVVRRGREANKTRLVVVDYLQLLHRPRRYDTVNDAINQTMSILADAAKELDVAFLVMSQLNRKVEERTDKRPLISDLRDSGTIEERSKCVLALYRGSYYGPPVKGQDYEEDEPRPTDDEFARRVDVLVLKNNQGQTGAIRRRWDGPTTRVY